MLLLYYPNAEFYTPYSSIVQLLIDFFTTLNIIFHILQL